MLRIRIFEDGLRRPGKGVVPSTSLATRRSTQVPGHCAVALGYDANTIAESIGRTRRLVFVEERRRSAVTPPT
jgi:hypothetical protein